MFTIYHKFILILFTYVVCGGTTQYFTGHKSWQDGVGWVITPHITFRLGLFLWHTTHTELTYGVQVFFLMVEK